MKFYNQSLIIIAFILFSSSSSNAQIQVDEVSMKGFSAVGFGAFFNLSFSVSDASYVTVEGGVDAFSKDDNNVYLAPVLAGYRYTVDGSGTGFYVEPNAGYNFGSTDIQIIDQNGDYTNPKLTGPAGGVTFGYLFPVSEGGFPIQFNIGIRYEHVFGTYNQNMFSFRISHAFTFGRRNNN